MRDLAEFLEVYGLPMKVGKYPSGATPEQKSALMRAVMDIGSTYRRDHPGRDVAGVSGGSERSGRSV
ncbi:DUF935 family protein [Escherichia coli]|nr:DUF935 family protein [Escherichia coli]